jgi:hypothetical protein
MPDDVIEQGQGLKIAPTSLGWGSNSALDKLNADAEVAHQAQFAPIAKTVMQSMQPDATPEIRKQSADAIKNFATSDEFRWTDLLSSKNLGDVVKAFNGGSDKTKIAYDKDGNEYLKIFNQRVTTDNPLGELRRIMSRDGKKVYSPEELSKIGPVTTLEEVPLTQQPFFMANQISAKDVATAQAKDWNNKQIGGSYALKNSVAIRDAAAENKQITKELLPYSINPHTRELLAKANEIRTGSSASTQSATEKLNKLATGKGTKSDWEELKKLTGGVTMGLNYNEAKGLTNGSGESATREDIDSAMNSLQRSASSDVAITSRKQDLLEAAQLLAAQGKIQNIDAIQRYINNQYIIGKAMNQIEENGGIGVAQPNLPYAQGDSFSLAHTKAVLDEAYADLAEQYGNKVFQTKQRYGNLTPGIGAVESELAIDPTIVGRKRSARDEIAKFLVENKDVLESINKQGVNKELMQAPSQAKPPPEQKVEVQPVIAGSKPPEKTTEKAKESKPKLDLNLLIPIKRKQ